MAYTKSTKALIDLLDDPDQNVFDVVEKELVKKNAKIIPALEEKWENSYDEVCQHRIENLIKFLHIKELKSELKAWAKTEDHSLLQGFFIINKFINPDLNFQKIERKIEQIRKDVWLELNDSLTSLEKTTILNHIFFNIHGYSINHSNINSPGNYFLNEILETKMGNAHSISMLYLVIAQLLELPVYFVNFPGNPLLAYFHHDIARHAPETEIDTDIIFYINPANNGSITGRKELEYHIKKLKFVPDTKFYDKGDNRVFLLKLISGLQKNYESSKAFDKAEIIGELKEILKQQI